MSTPPTNSHQLSTNLISLSLLMGALALPAPGSGTTPAEISEHAQSRRSLARRHVDSSDSSGVIGTLDITADRPARPNPGRMCDPDLDPNYAFLPRIPQVGPNSFKIAFKQQFSNGGDRSRNWPGSEVKNLSSIILAGSMLFSIRVPAKVERQREHRLVPTSRSSREPPVYFVLRIRFKAIKISRRAPISIQLCIGGCGRATTSLRTCDDSQDVGTNVIPSDFSPALVTGPASCACPAVRLQNHPGWSWRRQHHVLWYRDRSAAVSQSSLH
ncbi:hypothetical protein PCANC_23617 [Puccinia coronata f. sp. avenae]|uniref:Uncharacterized protein n=1 Tax=Puccinia coronata f. sp. avenae TaxID=200324 RepID=A0A2N5S8M7_9BASI|nr:hypothetical protein PCANC_23617 [Puccinia coronata f. sp. avenae]